MVDLRERALTTSRRITVRRRALASAAVAVTAVIAGTAFLLRPAPADVAPGPSATSASPRRTDEPTPTPASSPTVADTTSHPPAKPAPAIGAWQSTAAPSLPGTAVYVTATGDAAPYTISVHRLANGTRQTRTLGPVTDNGCAAQSATISPDGEWLAFVLGDAVGLTHGDELYAVNLTDGTTRLLARGVDCTGGNHPIWWPDSASLRVTRGQQLGRVDLATGGFTPLPPAWRDYVAFAPGGGPRVVAGRLETADGQLIRQLPPVPSPPPVGSSIQAVSADGRYVAVGAHNTDPGVQRGAFEVMDTVSGQVVGLATLLGQEPPGGEQLSNVFFLANGGMIVCTNVRNTPNVTWRLVRAVGSVTATLTAAPTFVSTGQFTYLG